MTRYPSEGPGGRSGQHGRDRPVHHLARRQHGGEAHRAGALHVVVEGEDGVAVAVEDASRVAGAEVLPVQQGVREEATLGARTTLDVLNAEQELLNARVALVRGLAAVIIASDRDLEISDLPPPETVQGLWQKVPSAVVPISRQRWPAVGLTISTL